MKPLASTENFVAAYRRALADGQLQQALAKATAKFTAARAQAVVALGVNEWEMMRDRAREVKEHTISNLDYYLEQFAANVERFGGRICWARDAEEANRYIVTLARRRGVHLVVKSKSMMTEEVELNRALEVAGVEAVETDLGEYIVQLAGERPSHITAPAIHKTRGEIADLFTDKLHVERTDEITDMTALARRVLRAKFAAAEMGVTGANFAVAETGTLVLVENEGNIRLTTSLPRVHVALLGIEKLIPRLEDLDIFLKLLPRSASGQQITSYLSFLSGVKRAADEEGPEELHVVLLDNGRSRMMADPRLRESLYCIRCGACLNACPVYQKIGGHAYGWIYPGPIGAVLTPQLIGRRRAADLPFASSLCGACREVCPLKINIPDMLLHLRHQIKEPTRAESPATRPTPAAPGELVSPPSDGTGRSAARQSPTGRLKRRLARYAEHAAFRLWAAAMMNARRYRFAARVARWAERVLGPKVLQNSRLSPLSRWAGERDLPRLAGQTFREHWAKISRATEGDADRRG
jgi:L-lactate dehydrogenase complex protein LldF